MLWATIILKDFMMNIIKNIQTGRFTEAKPAPLCKVVESTTFRILSSLLPSATGSAQLLETVQLPGAAQTLRLSLQTTATVRFLQVSLSGPAGIILVNLLLIIQNLPSLARLIPQVFLKTLSIFLNLNGPAKTQSLLSTCFLTGTGTKVS